MTDLQGGVIRGPLQSAIDVIVRLLFIAAALSFLWATWARRPAPTPETEPATLAIGDAPRLGQVTAPIVLVEFADFECPFCARFADSVLPQLKARFIDSGALQLAFMHFPLDALHRRARPAAAASECARRQGQFWRFHDLLFGHIDEASGLDAAGLATIAGLDVSAFAACLSQDATTAVDRDTKLATRLGLKGTPTFVLGVLVSPDTLTVRTTLEGAGPIDRFAAAIDRLRNDVD